MTATDAGRAGQTERTRARARLQTLTNPLLLAGIACAALILADLFLFGGWTYYRTPLSERGHAAAHRLLRPAGRGGQIFGIGGTLITLATLLYVLRKKFRRLSRFGAQKNWLEVHIFCGIVGPVLITLHTALKFNGVVSIAYWSMVLVVLSGFAGRYLYVRVPRTIRGKELTLGELTARAEELSFEIENSAIPDSLAARIAEFERQLMPRPDFGKGDGGLLLGEFLMNRKLRRFRAEIRSHPPHSERLEEALDLMRERAVLLRRIAYLAQTKKLFSLWHVFHKPLVYVMLAIAALHVAVALYFGYSLVHW